MSSASVAGDHQARNCRVYVTGSRKDLQVPFREVALGDSPGGEANAPFRLYDTAGPGSVPEEGLPPLRRRWIDERGHTETYAGRSGGARDDGRTAARDRRRRRRGQVETLDAPGQARQSPSCTMPAKA